MFTATETTREGCRSPRLSRALQMESYPKFHNEVGVPIVRIGCREFKCIGDKPPQDHPHVYLNMGDKTFNKDLTPREVYDAVMAASGLFEVEPAPSPSQ